MALTTTYQEGCDHLYFTVITNSNKQHQNTVTPT